MSFFSNICSFCLRSRRSSPHPHHHHSSSSSSSSSSLFFTLPSLQIATNFFSDSNLLGRGGFGPVYKGLLPNGQEVAIKKLSLNSRQGLKEFTNEVKLLLRIQHKNLVMLMGCCVEGPEKMLVYEYLRHRSLDYYLFGKNKSPGLEWTKRFQMVKGIARGLLYLHEEAPERIIHRDIKASNILLDDELNPKIADFGLARLFPDDESHLSTLKIAGTHGYMAPEYAMRGYLSVKTDVFSFGILVLEIVSGRRNHDRSLGAEKGDLLNFAWKLFQGGRWVELVDPGLEKCNVDEARMCIHLGLLCCQGSVSERPEMNTVHVMLSSDSFTLPKPGKPGIHGRVGGWTTTSSTPFTEKSENTKTNTNTNTNTNTDGGSTAVSGKVLTVVSSVSDYSINSMSHSSMDEGR